jgi:catechol 2,3-dioxygenase-like lactoylglutathione lyase family enzyme
MIHIDRLDHLVLTVSDIQATCAFYERILGMQTVTFGHNRTALHFGQQKINLHPIQNDIGPLVADKPMAGTADLCFITITPMQDVVKLLTDNRVEIIAGPVSRSGALGPILSVYFRDPDNNLIEVSNYEEGTESEE